MQDQQTKKELFNRYKVEEPHFAKGSYGSIAKAKDLRNKSVVIKAISNKVNVKWISNEIVCGTLLKGHPSIPLMREAVNTFGYHFLVFDYVDGIELFDFLEKRSFSPLEESSAKHLFKQLLDCIYYCHENGIAHRDLKLENVMVDYDMNLFVVDFGLAAIKTNTEENFVVNDYVGSENYTAPEVLKRTPYNPLLADVWSMGVILYCLLFGQFPLDSSILVSKHKELPHLEFPKENDVSDEAKDLISKMLQYDPSNRASVSEILEHSWLTQESIK